MVGKLLNPFFSLVVFLHSPEGTLGLMMLPYGSWEGSRCSQGLSDQANSIFSKI